MKSFFLSIAALCFFSASSQASIMVFSGTLSGANEVPLVVSGGLGVATVTLDDVANTLRVEITFSGLTGTSTNAHIHGPAGPDASAGVLTTTPKFVGFPSGVTSGSMDQTYDLTLASTYNATFVTSSGSVANAQALFISYLTSGQAYLNVHSSTSPGGEIRANLAAVPEPSTMALGAMALAGLWTIRRRLF